MFKLILTQGCFFSTNDYGRPYTFKIYDENDVPFDASNYNAPVVKIFDHAGNAAIRQVDGVWTSPATGVGTFAFSSTHRLTMAGPYHIEVQLEKPGTVISTGRKRIIVFASPP